MPNRADIPTSIESGCISIFRGPQVKNKDFEFEIVFQRLFLWFWHGSSILRRCSSQGVCSDTVVIYTVSEQTPPKCRFWRGLFGYRAFLQLILHRIRTDPWKSPNIDPRNWVAEPFPPWLCGNLAPDISKLNKFLLKNGFPPQSVQGFGHKGNETTGLETSQDVSERMRIGVGHYVCVCMYTHMPACKHRPRQRDWLFTLKWVNRTFFPISPIIENNSVRAIGVWKKILFKFS